MKGLKLGIVGFCLLFSNSALCGDIDAGEARYAQNSLQIMFLSVGSHCSMAFCGLLACALH